MTIIDKGRQVWTNEAALSAAYRDHVQSLMARHDHALQRAGATHAVLFAGAPKHRFLDDNDYPFRPNPHFTSWLPLTDNPFCYLVYTPGETPVLVYYQERDYWHRPPSDPEGFWTEHFDIRVVHSLDDVAEHLPVDRDRCILIGDVEDDAHAFGIDRVNPTSVINILHYARARKTGYELECMRAASLRGASGHRAAESAFRSGATEFEIHLVYCRAVRHTDNELPYGNIIAVNENAAVLHYQHQSTDAPDVRRSFLIDAGAQVNGYASDITRTYSARDDAFADVVARMHELQQDIVGEVRAGIDYAELHVATHARIAGLIVDLELAAGSTEALIANGVTSAFFPHGLGHFLGLQVHDVGGFMADESGKVIDRPPGHPFLRLTRTLEPDQVLTIEPGLYVIDLLLDNLRGTPGYDMLNHRSIDALRPYGGVRIEDNVRVLPDGCENLTRNAFDAA